MAQVMRMATVIAEFGDLRDAELRDWLERGWVHGEPSPPDDWEFAEIDVARIRLVRDLRHVMAVQEDTVPLVLDLLDQVYGLRRSLRAVATALQDQPDHVRRSVGIVLRDVV